MDQGTKRGAVCRQTQWRRNSGSTPQGNPTGSVSHSSGVSTVKGAGSPRCFYPCVCQSFVRNWIGGKKKRTELGPSLVVQWLRLWASNLGFLPVQGIKIPNATWYGQKKRKKKKNPPWEDSSVERILVFCAYCWEKLVGLAVESRGPPEPPW